MLTNANVENRDGCYVDVGIGCSFVPFQVWTGMVGLLDTDSFTYKMFVRLSLCRRQHLPKIRTLLCLVNIKKLIFSLLCVFNANVAGLYIMSMSMLFLMSSCVSRILQQCPTHTLEI